MNEYESRWDHDQRLDERVRAALPALFAVFLGLVIASSILAWGEVYTSAFFVGLAVVTAALLKPEWALLVVTILAPLETLTVKMGSLIPGTGITPVNLVVIILLAGAWLQRYSTSEPSVEATSVDKPLLLYLGWTMVALVVGILMWGVDAQAAGEWLAMVCGYAMYWIVRRRWRSDKLAIGTVWVILAMEVLQSVLVIKATRDHTSGYTEKLKYLVTGTFTTGNSNDVATYLSVYCMIALGLFLAMRWSLWRWPALAVFLVGSAATFYTYSRAAYIALLAGALAVVLFKHKRYLVPGVIVVMLLPGILPASIMERANMSGDASGENRKEFWKNGISIMMTHPLGIGWRGYSKNEEVRGQELKDPHSQYVLVAAEQGVVGITLFIVLLAAVGTEIVKATKRARTPFVQGLGVGLFGALIAFAVNNAFGTRMIWFASVQHFWLLLGLLMVLSRRLPGEAVEVEVVPVREPKPVSPWRYNRYV